MNRKHLGFVLIFLSVAICLVGCQKKEKPKPIVVGPDVITTKKAEASTTQAPPPQSTTQVDSQKPVTYYTEDAENPYVQKAAAHGANPQNSIALIRTNTKLEGATVLEFSGETDKNGVPIRDESTLLAVYDIEKVSGRIRKATKDGTGNVGYTEKEGQAVFALAKRFMLPQLAKMKAERTSHPAN